MRILAAILLTSLPLAAAASAPAPSPAVLPAARAAQDPGLEGFDRMNVYSSLPHCKSIPRQVAGAERRTPGTRLDRQPPGRLLYAVERQVDGCREIVLVSEERRRRR